MKGVINLGTALACYATCITILVCIACGGTGRQRAAVAATCTAATLASVKAKLPDDTKSAAIELAAEEVSCVLAGLAALPSEGGDK